MRKRVIALLLVTNLPLWAATSDRPPVKDPKKVIAEVVAVVGNIPITSVDLAEQMKIFKKRKGVKKDRRNLKSQVLDLLISREIVNFVADDESVTVSAERVDNAIKKQMKMNGIKKEKAYKVRVRRQLNLSWSEYRKEVRRQLKTQQVVQLRVSVPNPTPSQIDQWYRINKKKIGKKYLLRIIVKKFDRNNIKDELRVSKLMKTVRRKASRNFSEAAKEFSDHASKKRGGLVGWVRLEQLALQDQILAGAVQRTRVKRVSQRFVTSKGYCIIKVEAVKAVPVEEVYEQIRSILYSQNEQAAFAQWVRDQRKKISVNIFLEKYQGI